MLIKPVATERNGVKPKKKYDKENKIPIKPKTAERNKLHRLDKKHMPDKTHEVRDHRAKQKTSLRQKKAYSKPKTVTAIKNKI